MGLILVAVLALASAGGAGFVFASHQFTDVPDSNTFHNDIDAIADAGVTSGCGAGIYCPKDYVTREQMAAFMNRLGALSPSKTPVVNADKVDGYQAADLIRITDGGSSATVALTTSNTAYGEVILIAPVAGFALVSSTITYQEYAACSSSCYVNSKLYHVETVTAGRLTMTEVDNYATASNIARFPIQAGTNHFQLLAQRGSSSGTINGYFSTISVIFVPFSGSGLPPLGPEAELPADYSK